MYVSLIFWLIYLLKHLKRYSTYISYISVIYQLYISYISVIYQLYISNFLMSAAAGAAEELNDVFYKSTWSPAEAGVRFMSFLSPSLSSLFLLFLCHSLSSLSHESLTSSPLLPPPSSLLPSLLSSLRLKSPPPALVPSSGLLCRLLLFPPTGFFSQKQEDVLFLKPGGDSGSEALEQSAPGEYVSWLGLLFKISF